MQAAAATDPQRQRRSGSHSLVFVLVSSHLGSSRSHRHWCESWAVGRTVFVHAHEEALAEAARLARVAVRLVDHAAARPALTPAHAHSTGIASRQVILVHSSFTIIDSLLLAAPVDQFAAHAAFKEAAAPIARADACPISRFC